MTDTRATHTTVYRITYGPDRVLHAPTVIAAKHERGRLRRAGYTVAETKKIRVPRKRVALCRWLNAQTNLMTRWR